MAVIAYGGSGISNRLKRAVSAFRLDENARVLWQQDPAINNCRFSDLFENDIEVTQVSPNDHLYTDWRLLTLPTDNLNGYFPSVPFVSSGYLSYPQSPRHVDFEYHRIPRVFQMEIVRQFLRLKVKPQIKDEVDNFHTPQVSVQLRTWKAPHDVNHGEAISRRKFFNLEWVFSKIDSFPENHSFFITGDCDEVIETIQNRYKNRAITYNRKTLRDSPNHYEKIKEDLTELLIGSKASNIIGSLFSTFTECMWYLGGCKARVILPVFNGLNIEWR